MTDFRDAWTAYAQAEGLVQTDAPRPVSLPPVRNKFHAEPVTVDGRRFASRKEAARYLELRLLEKHGAIADLECQPVFPLHVLEVWRSQVPIRITTIGKFTADFRFTNLTLREYALGEIVVEDTKSTPTKTEAYRLRKRLAEVVHGITVTEL